MQCEQDALHWERRGQRGNALRDLATDRYQEDWCRTAMHNLLCHFARGFFRGRGGALRAHHHEIHPGCQINDVVSRMTLTHKLLHG